MSMAGKTRATLQSLLDGLRDDGNTAVEKTASEQDSTLALLNDLKAKVQTDVNTERLVKQANDVSQAFAEQLMQKLAGDEFIEKIADRVSDMLIEKLAIEASEEVIGVGTDVVPQDNPQEVIEDMADAAPPAESVKAQKVKEELLNKQMVEGAVVEGEADEEKKASFDLDALLAYLNQ